MRRTCVGSDSVKSDMFDTAKKEAVDAVHRALIHSATLAAVGANEVDALFDAGKKRSLETAHVATSGSDSVKSDMFDAAKKEAVDAAHRALIHSATLAAVGAN